jgi:hypothetical protein
MFLAEQPELGQWMRATKNWERSQCTIVAIRKLSTHRNNYRASCTRLSNSCERYQHQHLRMYCLHHCWIPSLWNHGTWVGQCRILRHFDLCAKPHSHRRHCCWTYGWVCDEGARNAITWLGAASMTIASAELAHLDQRLLTRVKAEKRCVLIIQGQYRMGTEVLTICGL